MMRVVEKYITGAAVAGSLCALGALGGFIWMIAAIEQERDALAGYVTERNNISQRDTYVASLHALARDTVEEREELASFIAGEDTVETVSLLRETADAAGVQMEVRSVNAVQGPADVDADTIGAVTITLRAQGTFGNVFHMLALLETLPHAISVEEVNIERIPTSETGQWSMTTELRVLAHN